MALTQHEGLLLSDTTKHLSTKGLLDGPDAGTDAGALRAVFSTFNEVDSDGDIVLPEAFTPGQPVPMVYGHDWAALPIGKGAIAVEPNRAIFDGHFFTETTHGRDAYLTVKAMGDLQEYSWGFRILDAEPGSVNGQPVRFIKSAEVYEVSPVLVGANRHTYTLSLKGHGLAYEQHSDNVRVAVAEWLERTRAGLDVRAKEGRAISSARRTRMEAVMASLRSGADEIDALLKETAPPEKSLAVDLDALYVDFLAIQSALRGAPVPARS